MTAIIDTAQGHGITDRTKTLRSRINAGQRRDLANDSASISHRGAPIACTRLKTTPETNSRYRSVKIDDPSSAATLLPRWRRATANAASR